MKLIEIDGQKFEYKIIWYSTSSSSGYYTEFYQGIEIKSRKKYLLWGEVIKKEVPKLMFKIWTNIEDPRHSKEHIKKLLLDEIKLINRQKEIEKGEII